MVHRASRRLNNPDGSFAGIVTAPLSQGDDKTSHAKARPQAAIRYPLFSSEGMGTARTGPGVQLLTAKR